MKLFLIGYMGSGKSTIGKMLADKLGVPFYDTDELIEKRKGRSISDIFAQEGEVMFRKYERKLMEDLAVSTSSGVYATGGGLPCFEDNMDLINKIGISIYLKCGIDLIISRIKESEHRPLVKNKSLKKLKTFVKKHLAERKPVYKKASITVMGYKSPVEIRDRILSLLT